MYILAHPLLEVRGCAVLQCRAPCYLGVVEDQCRDRRCKHMFCLGRARCDCICHNLTSFAAPCSAPHRFGRLAKRPKGKSIRKWPSCEILWCVHRYDIDSTTGVCIKNAHIIIQRCIAKLILTRKNRVGMHIAIYRYTFLYIPVYPY